MQAKVFSGYSPFNAKPWKALEPAWRLVGVGQFQFKEGPNIATNASEQFIQLMIQHNVLKFGNFTLKSGRRSPYFFNIGCIADGLGMRRLGQAYARAIVEQELEFDMLFGPAYKGIPIAVATAIALEEGYHRSVGIAFNRKEAKDHGEGGAFIGHELCGRILIVDDVMTAGTAVKAAVETIQSVSTGHLAGVLVALDRQERLQENTAGVQVTAVTKVSEDLAVPVKSIANLGDVIAYLEKSGQNAEVLAGIREYQRENCVQSSCKQ